MYIMITDNKTQDMDILTIYVGLYAVFKDKMFTGTATD